MSDPSPDNDVRRLAEALGKLSQCQEPSEVVYGDTPIPAEEPALHGAGEAYGITVARRISTVLGRLSELSKVNRQRVLTPRGVLLELMDIVQHGLFLSLPPAMRHVGHERASLASSFHTYVSSRLVPVEAMVEGLHSLTYVSVKLRLELVTMQLKHRLAEEIAAHAAADEAATPHSRSPGAAAVQNTEEALAALLITETLLDDFMETFNNALLLAPVMATAASAALRAPASAAVSVGLAPGASTLVLQDPAALAALIPTLERYYYQLGDWTLLTTSAAAVSPVSFTKVTRVSLDEKKGTVEVELHRPHASSPWGLLFNERGRLVGVDTSMRVGAKARELHALLRCSQEGAQVAAVNGVPVRSVRPPAGTNTNQGVLTAVQAASAKRKRIKLTLASANFKTHALHAPAELVFSHPAQGGEGASGQRASLLFHRLNVHTPWQFAIDGNLMWFPPPPRLLSEGVRGFVRGYPYRLRVLAVNGVEVQSPVQMREMVAGVEVLLLELVVVPVSESAPHVGQANSADGSRRKAKSEGAVTASSGTGTVAVEAAAAAAAPVVQTCEVTAEAVAAIEQQVREATQRLMLTHAQQEELREVPVVALVEPPTMKAAALPSTAPADAEAMATGADVDRILEEMLRAAGVDTGDAAGANAKLTAHASEPAAQKRKKGKGAKKATALNTIDDSTAVSVSDEPDVCRFANDVTLLAFDGEVMEFRRASAEHPWGIQITQNTTTDATDEQGNRLPLRVLALPVPLPESAAHPFLAQFSTGKAAWLIESINGKSAAMEPKKVLDLMRKSMQMKLRLIRH